MLAEQIVYTALTTALGTNATVYPDVAPAPVAASGNPFAVYQAVGGVGSAYVDGTAQALLNTRMQVAVWARDRLTAATLMSTCYQALVNPTVGAVPLGAPVSVYESDTLLYGSRLDFSIRH